MQKIPSINKTFHFFNASHHIYLDQQQQQNNTSNRIKNILDIKILGSNYAHNFFYAVLFMFLHILNT